MSTASTGSNFRSTVRRIRRSSTLVEVKYGLDPPPGGTNKDCGSKPPQVPISVPPRFGVSSPANAGPAGLDASTAPAAVIRKSRFENLLILWPLLRLHHTGPHRSASPVPFLLLFCIQRRIGPPSDRQQRALLVEHVDVGDAD